MRSWITGCAAAAVVVMAFTGAADAQDFVWPVSGTLTQCFGDSFSGRQAGHYYDEGNVRHWFGGYDAWGYKMHRALDIAAATGTPVVAARDGVAWKRGYPSHFYGYHVVVDHGSGYYTLYAHFSAFGGFASGGRVALGETIGYVGTTGNVTGPHLHFEVRHVGESDNYAQEAHHVPCHGPSQGAAIAFDYPGIGPLGETAGPPPAPGWHHESVAGGAVHCSWEGVEGADAYRLRLEYWTGSAYAYYHAWTTGGTSFTVWPVYHGYWYRWQVQAHNASGWGDPTGFREFLFGDAPSPAVPGAPTGLAPDGWATVTSSGVGLSWSASGDAAEHEIEVLYWTGSTWARYWGWKSASESFTFWPAVHYTWYAWKVRSSNAAGTGDWSDWAYFRWER